ncbi:MAG: sterol desaturase family protein [Pseudomonadota bacterium]
MTLPLLLLAFTAIVLGRYVVVSGTFAAITSRARPGLHSSARSRRQQRAERRWSGLAALIYAVPTGLAFWAWREHGLTKLYTDPGEYGLWYLPVGGLVYLLAHDAWFYWTHRAMHEPRLFRVVHKVHHDSRPPTAWAAMSFHWTESLSGAILFPVMVFFVPVHVGALGAVLGVATFFGVTNHLGWEIFPARIVNGAFGRWVITASHHHGHHANYRSNYGLYFRFWDRLCGTDRGLEGDFGREEMESRARAAARRRPDGARHGAGHAAGGRHHGNDGHNDGSDEDGRDRDAGHGQTASGAGGPALDEGQPARLPVV